MARTKECRQVSELLSKITKDRFVWKLTRAWMQVKNDLDHAPRFWAQQKESLDRFDKEFPGHHGAGIVGERPQLPGPQMGFIATKVFTPLAARSPTPPPIASTSTPKKAQPGPAPMSPFLPAKKARLPLPRPLQIRHEIVPALSKQKKLPLAPVPVPPP